MEKNRLFFVATSLVASLNMAAQSVVFSRSHGFCDEPFELQMMLDEGELSASQTIRYTTDGSLPNGKSPVSSDLRIPIRHNTILRAAVIDADTVVGNVTTATYLFLDDVLRQGNTPDGYPSVWGSYCELKGQAKADYEMDPEMVQDAELRAKIAEGLQAIPTLSIVTSKDNFFSTTIDPQTGGIYIYTGAPVGSGVGRDWERPISMELFGGIDQRDVTIDCGIKIHGGHSRLPEKTPKHSLRLMFKDKFGSGKLKYRLFGTDGPKKFEQLVLRCAFGNTWQHWDSTNRKRAQYQRDMWARSTQHLMGHPSARGLYAHVYINGMYWGLYNIAERINDYYCSSNFGGDKDDYDVVKVEEYNSGNTIEASAGTLDAWEEMVSLAESSATSHSSYLKLIGRNYKGEKTDVQWLDEDNFIDYMLINQYAGNTDWDHHNWLAFRNRKTGDKGFRFICWDSELIFGSLEENVVTKLNEGYPTGLFSNLIQNVAFRHKYIDRVYQLMEKRGGLLTPAKVTQVWDSLYSIIQLPLYDEAARWGDYRRDVHPYTKQGDLYTVDKHYQTERQRLLNGYFPQRTSKLLTQIREAGWGFNTQRPSIRINGKEDNTLDTISVNDILTLKFSSITYYTLDGTDPVTWYVSTTGKISDTARKYTGGNILANYDWSGGNTLTIRAVSRGTDFSQTMERTFVVRDIPTDVDDILADIPTTTRTGIYDLSGRRLPDTADLPHGVYIINGKKIVVR